MKRQFSVYALSIVLAALSVAVWGQPPQRVDVALVLDFENKTGEMGEMLSRFATDAVAVELAATGRFEVLRRDEAARAIKELGLRPPLDSVSRRRLAQALGATVIVDGAIEFIRDDLKARPRSISVGMTVRMAEVSTGELIAGAAQVGTVRFRPDATDRTTLINEAITGIATTAPRQALSQAIPEGIIMSSNSFSRAKVRMINRGATHGVKKGMKFMVFRDGVRIGTVEAASVFPQHSEVRVLDGDEGMRTQDRIRAIGQVVGKLK